MKKTWLLVLSICLLLSSTAYASDPRAGFNGDTSLFEQIGAGNRPGQIEASYYGDQGNYMSAPSENVDYGYTDPNTYSDPYAYQPGYSANAEIDPEAPIIVPYGSDTPQVIAEEPQSSGGSSSGGTQSLDWYNVGFDLINSNKSITIYDINTGVTWGATYINGRNHADVIPASQADAQKLTANSITGSYVRRPVVVTIAGTRYAGSMYAVGHGETNYCNYFSGVMCIHFTGSQTHGSGKVDSDHQNAIGQALGYGN